MWNDSSIYTDGCRICEHCYLTGSLGKRSIWGRCTNSKAGRGSGGLWGTPYDLSNWRQGGLSQPRRWNHREYQHPFVWNCVREILPAAIWLQHDGAGAAVQCRQHRAAEGNQGPGDFADSLVPGDRLVSLQPRLEGPLQGEQREDAERGPAEGRRGSQEPATTAHRQASLVPRKEDAGPGAPHAGFGDFDRARRSRNPCPQPDAARAGQERPKFARDSLTRFPIAVHFSAPCPPSSREGDWRARRYRTCPANASRSRSPRKKVRRSAG